MKGFLTRHCGKNPGNIVDSAGNAIGQHEGLWFYTIGQRKGVKLSGGPYYVNKKISPKTNWSWRRFSRS